MFKKGPTVLKAYIIPVLLLNLVLGAWGVVAAQITNNGLSIYLGYAIIVSISLYLYLLYLDRYI